MIIIGTFEAVVTDSRYREFLRKANPEKNLQEKLFKVNEISFFSETLNITGVLSDWDLTIPADELKRGMIIKVNFNKCNPAKGFRSHFEFSGFPSILNTK